MQIKTSLYILLTSAITFSACTHNKKTENTQIQTVSKTDNSAKTSAEGNVTYLSTSDFRLKIMESALPLSTSTPHGAGHARRWHLLWKRRQKRMPAR